MLEGMQRADAARADAMAAKTGEKPPPLTPSLLDCPSMGEGETVLGWTLKFGALSDDSAPLKADELLATVNKLVRSQFYLQGTEALRCCKRFCACPARHTAAKQYDDYFTDLFADKLIKRQYMATMHDVIGFRLQCRWPPARRPRSRRSPSGSRRCAWRLLPRTTPRPSLSRW